MKDLFGRCRCAAQWLLLTTVVQGLVGCGGGGSSTPTAQELCSSLNGMSVSTSAIGKPTSGAVVQSSTFVAGNASGNANGEHCEVKGMIFPATAGAPTMEFQVNLPSTWNQRALQMGGGGYDGTLVTGLDTYTSQLPGTDTPLKQGYVTLGGDGGHKGSVFDGTFALNDEALLNYGQQSIKKVHDVAVAVVTKRYGAAPKRFYFIGGSQGGHEALDAAARYPADYDGVVANYPAYNLTLLQLASLHVGRALFDNSGAGWLSPNKLKLLTNAVNAACDSLDGLSDNIISNVAACNRVFNIITVRSTLRCPGGADTGDSCLSDAQIAAVEKISTPYDVGFPVAGQQTFGAWPLLEGGTFTLFGSGSGLGFTPIPSGAAAFPADGILYAIGAAHARYFAAKNPLLDPLAYDPAAYKARLQAVGEITDVTSQSLDAFRAKGGKVILTHGTMDSLISPHNSIDYYNRQVQTMGQSAVDSFLRFYMVPGFDHGWGTFALSFDGLNTLVNWVENTQAPDVLIATDANQGATRTRPMCRWPTYPSFTGPAGTANNASGYACVAP